MKGRCLRCCSVADEHVEARRLREKARLLLKADKWMGKYVCCRIGARISEALLRVKLTNKRREGGVVPDVRGRCLGLRFRRQEMRSMRRGERDDTRQSLEAFVCESG